MPRRIGRVGREQTGDREVRAEHAAVDAEDRDGVEDDAAIAFDRPGAVGQAELGHLDMNVGRARQRRHALPPCREALGAAIPRIAGVIERDRRIGKVAGELGRFVEMPERHAKIVRQAMLAQVARNRRAISDRPSCPACRADCRQACSVSPASSGCRETAESADVPGKLLIALRIGEPDVADHGVGKAILRVDLVQPSRLLDLLVAVVLRLDMDRLDDVEACASRR